MPAHQQSLGLIWNLLDIPVHTYSSAGAHTVNLVVSNANRTASKETTIYVLKTTSSNEETAIIAAEKLVVSLAQQKGQTLLQKKTKELLELK